MTHTPATFGNTPTEGWTQETDPTELDEQEATELWKYRTGPYALGEYEAIIARTTWAPDTYHLTVFRDEVGPLVEDADVGNNLAQAKEDGVGTIAEAIGGF